MSRDVWAEAIDASLDDAGLPTIASVGRHIRAATLAAGVLRRGQITRGLGEAYAPFGIDEGDLRALVDRVVGELELIGDLTELKTASGAAYIPTPARLVDFGDGRGAVLGGYAPEDDAISSLARQLPAGDWPPETDLPRVGLSDEIGVADWRPYLVEAGGVDAPLDTPESLFSHLARLSAGGDRLETLTPDKVRVLAGRQSFFGRVEAPQLEGRWQAIKSDGVFCAARQVGHGWRACVAQIIDGAVTIFETQDWDLWRWAIIGQTLADGDEVCRFEDQMSEFTMQTPPPRQVRRLMDLASEALGAWRWRTSPVVANQARALLGQRRH